MHKFSCVAEIITRKKASALQIFMYCEPLAPRFFIPFLFLLRKGKLIMFEGFLERSSLSIFTLRVLR